MITRVITFGTFDYFHPGHEFYLQQAADLGQQLIVVIARDNNVYKIKGRPARQSEFIRKQAVNKFLKNAKLSGKAILGNQQNFYFVIKKYQPQVIALGYDQKINQSELMLNLKKLSIKPKIIRLTAYYPEKYKSSLRHPN